LSVIAAIWATVATIAAQVAGIQAKDSPTSAVRLAVLVASNDPAIHTKLVRVRRAGLDISTLRESFPEPRFAVDAWAGVGAILIDRRVPAVHDLACRADMAEALASKLGDYGQVRVGDLEGAGNDSTRELLDKWFPPQLRSADLKIEDLVVAVTPCLNLTVSGPNGVSQTLALPHLGERTEKAHQAVEKTPLRLGRPSSEERSEMEARAVDSELTGGELITRFFGPDRSVIPGGIERLGKLLARMADAERARLEKATLALSAKLGLGQPGLPASAGLNDLPKNLRDELSARLKSEYLARGFATPRDAESFLLNCQSVQIRTAFGLLSCQTPRDPDNRKPGAFSVHDFTVLPGGVWPP